MHKIEAYRVLLLINSIDSHTISIMIITISIEEWNEVVQVKLVSMLVSVFIYHCINIDIIIIIIIIWDLSNPQPKVVIYSYWPFTNWILGVIINSDTTITSSSSSISSSSSSWDVIGDEIMVVIVWQVDGLGHEGIRYMMDHIEDDELPSNI